MILGCHLTQAVL